MEYQGTSGNIFTEMRKALSRDMIRPYGWQRRFYLEHLKALGKPEVQFSKSQIERDALKNLLECLSWRHRKLKTLESSTKRTHLEPKKKAKIDKAIDIIIKMQSRVNNSESTALLDCLQTGKFESNSPFSNLIPEPRIVMPCLATISGIEFDLREEVRRLKEVAAGVPLMKDGFPDFDRHFRPLLTFLDNLDRTKHSRLQISPEMMVRNLSDEFDTPLPTRGPTKALERFILKTISTMKARVKRSSQELKGKQVPKAWALLVPNKLTVEWIKQSPREQYRPWAFNLMKEILMSTGCSEHGAMDYIGGLIYNLKGKSILVNQVIGRASKELLSSPLPDPELLYLNLNRLRLLLGYKKYLGK